MRFSLRFLLVATLVAELQAAGGARDLSAQQPIQTGTCAFDKLAKKFPKLSHSLVPPDSLSPRLMANFGTVVETWPRIPAGYRAEAWVAAVIDSTGRVTETRLVHTSTEIIGLVGEKEPGTRSRFAAFAQRAARNQEFLPPLFHGTRVATVICFRYSASVGSAI